MRITLFSLAALSVCATAFADEPKPVPATRSDVKKILEESKHSTPRLPLPPLTDSQKVALDRQRAGRDKGTFGGVINNGRMREYYLSPEVRGEFLRGGDPDMPLDPTFRVMLFWITSRVTNCYYCLGHQESKLAAAGVEEDRIAALDGDWSEFTDKERVALAFARKLGREPNAIEAADIDKLRVFYDDNGILDIIVSVAGFNAMNRWTGALAIPQEEHRVYLTPTATKYRDMVSSVAPLDPNRIGKLLACAAASKRPPLESRTEVEALLKATAERTSRIRLVSDAKTKELLADKAFSATQPNWACLLANFPRAGKARIVSLRASMENGKLDPKLKAQVAWICARHDHAWYALGLAQRRLKALGCTDDQIFALDNPDDSLPADQKLAFNLARKLTTDPALVGDDDVLPLRKQFTDHQVAELIHDITAAAFLDRVTEAAGLPLER